MMRAPAGFCAALLLAGATCTSAVVLMAGSPFKDGATYVEGDGNSNGAYHPKALNVRLAELEIGDAPDAWRHAGFKVDEDGSFMLSDVRVHLVGGAARGVRSVVFEGPAPRDPTTVNGVAFSVRAPTKPVPQGEWHPNGACDMSKVIVEATDKAATQAYLEGMLNVTAQNLGGGSEAAWENLKNFEVLEIKSTPEPMGVEKGLDGVTLFISSCDFMALNMVAGPEQLLVGLRVSGARPLITFKSFQIGMSVNLNFIAAGSGGEADCVNAKCVDGSGEMVAGLVEAHEHGSLPA